MGLCRMNTRGFTSRLGATGGAGSPIALALLADIYKASNACKHQDYPFVPAVSSRAAEGAFMDFGRAVANWRNSGIPSRALTGVCKNEIIATNRPATPGFPPTPE